MRLLLSALFLVALSGCANSTKTYGPDGKAAYSLNCSGSARSWGHCEEKAGQICGAQGYTIVSRSTDQNAMMGGSGGNWYGQASNSRSMLIKCRE